MKTPLESKKKRLLLCRFWKSKAWQTCRLRLQNLSWRTVSLFWEIVFSWIRGLFAGLGVRQYVSSTPFTDVHMPLSEWSHLTSNNLMPDHNPCFSSQRTADICILHRPHSLLSPVYNAARFAAQKLGSVFLLSPWENWGWGILPEDVSYPHSPGSMCTLLPYSTLFLNHSPFLSVLPYLSF